MTPSIGRTYDRAGKLLTVTDAAGTRTFSYYDTWTNNDYESDLLGKSAQLKSETLPSSFFGSANNVLNYDYQYQVAGRANGPASSVTIGPGSAYSVAYGYDDVLRLNSVTYNGGTAFAYAYVPGSNLVHTVGQSGGYWRDYEYCPDSDRLYDLTHGMGNVTSSFMETRLTYDTVGRRNTEKTQGTGYMTALGRTADPGIHVDYSYTDRSEVNSSAKYVLNADWSVGSLLGGTGRDYEYDSIGNRDATYGYTPNNLNQYSAAPGFGSFTYDANGNMTGDGVRTYAYDAENRLITVTQGGYAWHYVYDYLGRRIEKSGSGIATTKFLYDSWDLIAELDDSGNIQNRYVWGIDASGTLSGAGGVGGLLLIDAGSAQYWPVYDASDNVIALYDSGGGFAAAYEYDPFGNLQTAQGSYVSQNVFLWSTKYTDGESGLVYYGMRYYSPQLGRFINRDPIGEAGGVNLYAFCGNDGVNGIDSLGCDQASDEEKARKAAEEAAALKAEQDAENKIEAATISRFGLGGLSQGFGDGTMLAAGQAAYEGTMAALSNDPQSVINSPDSSLRGAIQAEVDLQQWDLAAKDAIKYAQLIHSGSSPNQDADEYLSFQQGQSPASTYGSVLGNALRHIPLFGGMLGAAGDVVSGAANIALGVITGGRSGTLNRGLGQIAYGLSQELDIQSRDLLAGVAGTIGDVYVRARDVANLVTLGQIKALGKQWYGQSQGASGLVGSISRLLEDAPVPCYGNYDGSAWGVPNYGQRTDLIINNGDYAGFVHDTRRKDWQWIANQMTTNPKYQWVGPIGTAYALLGTPFFALRGLVLPGHR